MDAAVVIMRDHRAVDMLYEKFKNASEEEQEEIADEIFDGLDRHARMEEKYFYPELEKEGEKDQAMVSEAEAEHEAIKTLIKEGRGKKGADLEAHMKGLIEIVQHHVEEEETEMLPEAERTLGQVRLMELGRDMEPHSAVAQAGED